MATVQNLRSIFIIVVWFSLALGRPWEDSEASQLTETQKISKATFFQRKGPDGETICLFSIKYNAFVCTKGIPQSPSCDSKDPNCRLKTGPNDVQTMQEFCQQQQNGFCGNGPIGRELRRVVAPCKKDGITCLFFKRRQNNLKKASVRKGFGCNRIDDPTCLQSSNEPANSKTTTKRQKKMTCKYHKKDKFCRWRPQPMAIRSHLPINFN